MFNEKDFLWWTGVIENVKDDPLKIGRVKVRIYGFHDDDISEEDLPWALPIMPITSACVNNIGQSPVGVVKGSWCVGFFRDGHTAQDPLVWGTIYGVTNDDALQDQYGDEGTGPLVGRSEVTESDVNRINREVKEDTISEYKETSRITEPSSQDDIVYPNTTGSYSSRSGHHSELADTGGNERLSKYHVSGSYEEYAPNGNYKERIINDSYDIYAEDLYIHVSGDYEILTQKNLEILVKGDYSEEISQEKDLLGGVEITIKADGSKIELNP